jgi:predicted ATPase/DNA-binding SARP family transcriptional activator
VRVRLLGGFSVDVDGREVDALAWRPRRAKALVKLLALSPGGSLTRNELAALLWPDREPRAAANLLHHAIHAARRALDATGAGAGAAIGTAGAVVTLRAEIDVDAFAAAAAGARARPEPAAYEHALDLYGGELLPDDRGESWTAEGRDAATALHTALCLELADLRGAGAGGAATLRRALAADPLAEPVHRALMRLYARSGRRQRALAQYQLLRQALVAARGVEPDRQTRALYQALLPRAPALRAAVELPVAATSFVGRERERAELAELLARERVVTVVGPGGAGKTRLALETVAGLAASAPDGVWLVELAGLADGELVAQAAAIATGAPLPAHRPAQEALAAHLGDRDAIVVLDGCDHVAEACARLAEDLVAAGPRVRVLSTSREPLRCAGEATWRVPAMAQTPELFAQRAATARSGFAVTDADAAVVDHICRQLHGMPLAVELAGARAATLSLDQIAAGLRDRVGAVARTRADVMAATIEWSHEQLSGEERVLLRRLSVFAGGFELGAAQEVCPGGAILRRRIGDLLARLSDRALVVAQGGRFRLLEPIRRFATAALASAGERDTVRVRHLDWCLLMAEEHDPLAGGRRAARGLEVEMDNLRAALSFAVRRDPQTALLLATRLRGVWADRGYVAEGRRWLDAGLAAAGEPTPLRSEALLASATLSLRGGDAGECLRRLKPALDGHRALGDDAAAARALHRHALLVHGAGGADAESLLADALELARRGGDPRLLAVLTHTCALVAWSHADTDRARRRLLDALDLLERAPDDDVPFFDGTTFGLCVLDEGADGRPRLLWEENVLLYDRFPREQATAYALNNLAWVARCEREPVRARAVLDEALARFRSRWDRPGEALTLTHLGNLSRSVGEPDAGRLHLDKALALRQRLSDRRGVVTTTMALGMLAMSADHVDEGRRLLGEALARAEAVDDLPAMAGVQTNWAVAEERLDELARAARLYEDGGALWRVQGLGRPEGWAQLALHEVWAARGEDVAAHRALQTARTLLATDERGGSYAQALRGGGGGRAQPAA